jgi:hypothetical protein
MQKLLFVFFLAVAGCTSSTGPTDEATALALSRARWFNYGFTDYQFTIARGCECLPEMTGPVLVEVRGGVVAERRYISGTSVDPQYSDLFTAVPGLFDLIDEALRRDAAGLAVRYNAAFGYPESIQIDWVAGAVDDEVSYHITDFELTAQN